MLIRITYMYGGSLRPCEKTKCCSLNIISLLRGKYDDLINVTWDCFDQSNFYISWINILEWNKIICCGNKIIYWGNKIICYGNKLIFWGNNIHALLLHKGDMKICSPEKSHISRGQRPRKIWLFRGWTNFHISLMQGKYIFYSTRPTFLFQKRINASWALTRYLKVRLYINPRNIISL
jgi:hypothetical protein